jgi:hypothetical protein
MKKVLIGFTLILTLFVAAILLYLRSSSGFRSVYLVPSNAVLLVESRDPLMAWDNLVHSAAWEHLSTNNLLQEINEEIVSFDSLVNSSKFIMRLVGQKPVLISQHPISNSKYEMLYVVEVGKLAKYKKPEKILRSVFGKNYEITSRNYKHNKIIEILDLDEGVYYFMSLLHGKLIFSFEPKLVEASIDASEEMIVGRSRKFLDVYSKMSNTGLINIYINHQNLGPYLNSFSTEVKRDFTRMKHFYFSGIGFNIDEEGLISVEGYSSFSDSSAAIYHDLLRGGKLELETAEVIPQRIASLAKINFKNANTYFHSSMKAIGAREYNEYLENLAKIEKKFKINLEENFFSWMDKEMVLVQTQPSNLGRNNEFAAVLHAKDSSDAARSLQFMWRQIRKNSPVKIKSVDYRGYSIDYVAFPGFLKLLFGKLLDKIEKPYFTQIGMNVIISNHPQTIKNLIDDYLSANTLSNSIDYYNFNKLFSNKTSMFTYFEPPVLYHNMKAFLSPESWSNLKKNKKYFTCFNQAGISADLSGELLHFTLKAKYQPELEEWGRQYFNSTEIFSLFANQEPGRTIQQEVEEESKTDTIPVIIIHELDAKKQQTYHANGLVNQVVELKKGLKHGTFKAYHPNGQLYIKGDFSMDEPVGKWKYYSEDGELMKVDKY